MYSLMSLEIRKHLWSYPLQSRSQMSHHLQKGSKALKNINFTKDTRHIRRCLSWSREGWVSPTSLTCANLTWTWWGHSCLWQLVPPPSLPPTGNIFMKGLKALIHDTKERFKLSKLCNPIELIFYKPLVSLAWVRCEQVGWGGAVSGGRHVALATLRMWMVWASSTTNSWVLRGSSLSW